MMQRHFEQHPWLQTCLQLPVFVSARATLSRVLNMNKSEHKIEQLLIYLALLQKWNKAYNLTAIRDVNDMVTHHILDSLAILPWVNGPRVADIGSGAGLPGIPLAILNPALQVVLLDSNGKKIRFLQEVKRVLKLTNVEIEQARAESFHSTARFNTVTSRAFSSLEGFIDWTKHLIAEQGIWLAMKGRHPEQELASINHPYHVETYEVPGITGDRCCVIIENQISNAL